MVEYCKVMFDYKAKTEDELDLKKGDIVSVLKKVWASFIVIIFWHCFSCVFSHGYAFDSLILVKCLFLESYVCGGALFSSPSQTSWTISRKSFDMVQKNTQFNNKRYEKETNFRDKLIKLQLPWTSPFGNLRSNLTSQRTPTWLRF